MDRRVWDRWEAAAPIPNTREVSGYKAERRRGAGTAAAQSEGAAAQPRFRGARDHARRIKAVRAASGTADSGWCAERGEQEDRAKLSHARVDAADGRNARTRLRPRGHQPRAE